MKRSQQQLTQQLNTLIKTPPSAFLFYGQERGSIQTHCDQIRKQVQSDDEMDNTFDSEVFHAAELNEEAFFSACGAIPMFSQYRFVWLKEANKLLAGTVKELVRYLDDPNPDTILVLTAGPLDAKSPLRKQFEKHKTAIITPFYPMEGRERSRWIQEHLQSAGLQVAFDALRQLTVILDGDSENAARELEKLILYMGSEPRVQIEDVLAVVGETTIYNAFGLADAALEGNSKAALTMLDRLMDEGAEPIAILGGLLHRIRQIAQAKDLLADGLPAKQVGGRCRVFWKDQQRFFSICHRLSPMRIGQILLMCLEAEFRVRDSEGRERVMEGLIIQIAR
ncbi:MAG: DNA polymerase III subunit delta [Magnetococcales bacterium]|nr:DNA polymerase III subunit delta [Magnetococcales bacterium]